MLLGDCSRNYDSAVVNFITWGLTNFELNNSLGRNINWFASLRISPFSGFSVYRRESTKTNQSHTFFFFERFCNSLQSTLQSFIGLIFCNTCRVWDIIDKLFLVDVFSFWILNMVMVIFSLLSKITAAVAPAIRSWYQIYVLIQIMVMPPLFSSLSPIGYLREASKRNIPFKYAGWSRSHAVVLLFWQALSYN